MPINTNELIKEHAQLRQHPMLRLNVDQLRVLLLDAKEAHTEFEREHGPDEDWPRWYAAYILKRVNSGDVPFAGCR